MSPPPLRSPTLRPCAAPRRAPVRPHTAAPLRRPARLRPCTAPRCAPAQPLRSPTVRPCAAPRCYDPARPHAAPLPLVPQPTEGPSSGAPAPLHTRPPQPGLRDARAPGAPADPMEWGCQGRRRPPAGPPAPPRGRHGPRTRMAQPPPRPPAATHARGPGLGPQATLPASRWSRGPQWGPHRARRRPCTRAPHGQACAVCVPPAHPPTPWCGALRATAGRRPVRPHRPATATGPAPAWRRLRLGRPPLPERPAQA